MSKPAPRPVSALRLGIAALLACHLAALPLQAHSPPTPKLASAIAPPPATKVEEKIMRAAALPRRPTAAAVSSRQRDLQDKLAEARLILSNLQHMADIAKRAIEDSRRIDALSAEKSVLLARLADLRAAYQRQREVLIERRAQSMTLAKAVLATWLLSEMLERQEKDLDQRLVQSRAAVAVILAKRARLSSAQARRVHQRQALRARRDELRIHLDRANRERNRVTSSLGHIEREHQAIDQLSLVLRRDISRQLRALLAAP